MARLISILVAAALAFAPVVPAFAGPAEAAFLSRIAGNWSGNGRLTGADAGPISCRLAFKASGSRLNYTGRCNVQDLGGQGFTGSITYNDATKRYEVQSTAGLVVGIRRGNSIVFTTKSSSLSGTYYSTMTLSPSSISIAFTIIRDGQKTTSKVNFSR